MCASGDIITILTGVKNGSEWEKDSEQNTFFVHCHAGTMIGLALTHDLLNGTILGIPLYLIVPTTTLHRLSQAFFMNAIQ